MWRFFFLVFGNPSEIRKRIFSQLRKPVRAKNARLLLLFRRFSLFSALLACDCTQPSQPASTKTGFSQCSKSSCARDVCGGATMRCEREENVENYVEKWKCFFHNLLFIGRPTRARVFALLSRLSRASWILWQTPTFCSGVGKTCETTRRWGGGGWLCCWESKVGWEGKCNFERL